MNEVAAKKLLDALVADYERKIYDKNPLLEVILQVRFPTLLRLQTELPSAFQGEVIGEYPHYERQEALEVKVVANNAPPSLIQSRVHFFTSSGEKKWRI